MKGHQPRSGGPGEAVVLNDLLIQHFACKLPQPGRQHALSWACRLREEGRVASLQVLLEALLEATIHGSPVQKPFGSPAPSDRELPSIRELKAVVPEEADDGETRRRGPRPRADMSWARDFVREYSSRPAPSVFLGLQPKPRVGASCYMGVFG